VVTSPALAEAHERAVTRFADLVSSMPAEPHSVPGLEWNTIEVAAHELSVLRGYQRAATTGEPLWQSPTAGPAENQRLLDQTLERTPAELTGALASAGQAMRESLETADGLVPAFGSVECTPDVILGVNLGDVLVHGLDLSRALGRKWVLDAADAIAVLDAVVEILPAFVDTNAASGLTATYAVTLRNGPSFGFMFDNGELTIERNRPAHADCRVLASPVGLLLTSYGRVPVWRTAITGQVLAYGRKPWLAFRFTGLFLAP
jgi:hypothetical protein